MSNHHDELEELLGAYALDALDEDERRKVERMLESNPRARAEVQQHRETASMLAFSGSTAPDGLWDRIAANLEGTAPAPGPELARVIPMATRRQRWSRVAAAAAGVAAACIIAVLAYVAVDRGRQLDQLRPDAVQSALAVGFGHAMADPEARKGVLKTADGAEVQAVVEPNGIGYLAAQALPALPSGQTYQLWGVFDGTVISLGVLGGNPDLASFHADGSLQMLALTVEEGNGVPVTKNEPTAAATLD